jgi:hypothetical protein
VGLKLNGIHQLLAHADIVLHCIAGTINKNMETLIYVSQEVGAECRANLHIKITNSSFKNVCSNL